MGRAAPALVEPDVPIGLDPRARKPDEDIGLHLPAA